MVYLEVSVEKLYALLPRPDLVKYSALSITIFLFTSVFSNKLEELPSLIDINVETLKEMYPDLEKNKETIKAVLVEEKNKFVKTLVKGEREFAKEVDKLEQEEKNMISGKVVFKLYDTYGFPPEVTEELAKEHGIKIDLQEFNRLFKEHQEKSRQGAGQKFKGGLADQNEQTIAYHTATHLLHKH